MSTFKPTNNSHYSGSMTDKEINTCPKGADLNLQRFKHDPQIKASLIAQSLVHIYENDFMQNPSNNNNIKIKEVVEFLKNGGSQLGYNEKVLGFNKNIKYYYFEKDERRKIASHVKTSYELKSNVLETFKKSKNNSTFNDLLNKLTKEEKSGEIRPTYDLWTKMLWFLPYNAVLLLFGEYEKQFDEMSKKRNKSRTMGIKETNNSTIIFKGLAENAVGEIKSITIFNDVIYLCEKIVPILEKKIEHVLVVLEEETPKKQIVSKIVEISEKIEIPECSHLDSWEDF